MRSAICSGLKHLRNVLSDYLIRKILLTLGMRLAQTPLADFIHRARRHACNLTLAAVSARSRSFFPHRRRLDIRENFFVLHLRFYAVPHVCFSGHFKRQRRGGRHVDSLSPFGIIRRRTGKFSAMAKSEITYERVGQSQRGDNG